MTRSLGARSSASYEGSERERFHRKQKRRRKSERADTVGEREEGGGAKAKDSSSKKEKRQCLPFSNALPRSARPLLFHVSRARRWSPFPSSVQQEKGGKKRSRAREEKERGSMRESTTREQGRSVVVVVVVAPIARKETTSGEKKALLPLRTPSPISSGEISRETALGLARARLGRVREQERGERRGHEAGEEGRSAALFSFQCVPLAKRKKAFPRSLHRPRNALERPRRQLERPHEMSLEALRGRGRAKSERQRDRRGGGGDALLFGRREEASMLPKEKARAPARAFLLSPASFSQARDRERAREHITCCHEPERGAEEEEEEKGVRVWCVCEREIALGGKGRKVMLSSYFSPQWKSLHQQRRRRCKLERKKSNASPSNACPFAPRSTRGTAIPRPSPAGELKIPLSHRRAFQSGDDMLRRGQDPARRCTASAAVAKPSGGAPSTPCVLLLHLLLLLLLLFR